MENLTGCKLHDDENIKNAKTMNPAGFGTFFIFLGRTGLRPSEAIALLPTDLDAENHICGKSLGVTCIIIINIVRTYCTKKMLLSYGL